MQSHAECTRGFLIVPPTLAQERTGENGSGYRTLLLQGRRSGRHFSRDIFFGLFVEFTHSGEFLLGGGMVAGGLIDASKPVVRVGLLRVQFYGAFQRGDGGRILLL